MDSFKIDALEKRVDELAHADQTLYNLIRELQIEIEQLQQKILPINDQSSPKAQAKVNYLTEVNEQMFQQLVRLRQLIEHCIDSEIPPTQTQYLVALRGDE